MGRLYTTVSVLCQRLVYQMDAAHYWIDGHAAEMPFDEDDAECAAARRLFVKLMCWIDSGAARHGRRFGRADVFVLLLFFLL